MTVRRSIRLWGWIASGAGSEDRSLLSLCCGGLRSLLIVAAKSLRQNFLTFHRGQFNHALAQRSPSFSSAPGAGYRRHPEAWHRATLKYLAAKAVYVLQPVAPPLNYALERTDQVIGQASGILDPEILSGLNIEPTPGPPG